jgi:Fanconi anemia group M protein
LFDSVEELEKKGVKHPKLVELIRILKDELQKKPNSRIVVFAQFRDTVKQIVEELKRQCISARAFVGQRKGKGFISMTQLKQVKALRDFKDGLCSTLVATSVAEEGLDIAECDLVILYDAVPSEVRYIQRRGRVSRHHDGKVVTLITAGTVDEMYYLSAISKEKKMRDNIVRAKEAEDMRIEDFVFELHDNEVGASAKGGKGHEAPMIMANGDASSNDAANSLSETIRMIDPPRKVIVSKKLDDSELLLRLRETGLVISSRTTRAADVIIGDSIGVICAKFEDLVRDIEGYKLLRQRVKALKETFAVPFVLLNSSTSNPVEAKKDHVTMIYRVAAHIMLSDQVHFVVVRDLFEASNVIDSLARVPLACS